MLREEYFFIDKPFSDLVLTEYNTGSVVYNEIEKEWTFSTTGVSSDASCTLNLGDFNFGDRIVFECDAELITGDPARITLNKVTPTGTVSFYTYRPLTRNENGLKKRITFEILEDTAIQIKFGVNTVVGSTKIKNIRIKKITDSFHVPQNIHKNKLIASIIKTSTGWSTVANTGSDECVITEFDARQLQVMFTERLPKTYVVASATLNYSGASLTNHIIKTAFPGHKNVNLAFQDISTASSTPALVLLSTLPVGLRFDLVLQ